MMKYINLNFFSRINKRFLITEWRNMKILFINGVFNEYNIYEPLNVLVLLKHVKRNYQNYEVIFYEPALGNCNIDHAMQIACINPEIIVYSVPFQRDYTKNINLLNRIKSNLPAAKIILGGHDATLRYEEYFSMIPRLDMLILGPGENSIIKAIDYFIYGGDIHSIDGAVYIKNGILEKNIVCFDKGDILFTADRSSLGLFIREYGKLICDEADILSSRGCLWNCSFCSANRYSIELGIPKYYIRENNEIVDEMISIQSDFDIKKFNFVDDLFLLPGDKGLSKLNDLVNKIEKANLVIESLKICTRVDTLCNSEVIKLLRKLNVTQIYLGIESFCQYDLNMFNKCISSQKIGKTLDLLLEHGYSAEVGSDYRIIPGCIIFSPWVTIATLKYNLKMMKKYNFPVKRFLRKLIVYKNTDMYDILSKRSLINYDGKYTMDVEIEKIYGNCKQIIDSISLLRERIRRIQKLAKPFQLILPDEFEVTRKQLDSITYESFSRILEDSSKKMLEKLLHENKEEVENLFTEYLKKELEKYERMIEIYISTYNHVNPFIFEKLILSKEL